MKPFHYHRCRPGHSLIELWVAMISATVLLAGLGSVMLIARQVAYTPSGASRRTEAAHVISQLTDELQYATLVIGQDPKILEFVVADRNADGTSERIRYAWSGTSGDPLQKTINGGTPITVLETVTSFNAAYLLESKTTTITTTTESAETSLVNNASSPSGTDSAIASSQASSSLFTVPSASAPVGAIGWKATRVRFNASKSSSDTETLLVQLRAAGSFSTGPTSHVLGEVQVAESTLTGGLDWNWATFANPVRELAFDREYAITLVTNSIDRRGRAARA